MNSKSLGKTFEKKTKMNKNIVAALGGVVLEAYNNTLYGYFAVILAPLFFHEEMGISPITGSFLAFAAGYLGRPFGGILFGYLGDRFGRKTSLTISSLLTSIPIFIIGILPDYSSVGFLAPVLLVICRLLQGIAVGGDYTGALIYVAEQRGIKNKSLITCILTSIGFFGASIGVIISLFFSTSMIFSGSWRYSFISAALIGLYISYLRSRMDESQSYTELKEENNLEQNPMLASFKKDKKKLFACCILGGANFVPVYLATIYINLDWRGLLCFSTEGILLNNLLMFLLGGFLILLASPIIVRFGEIKIMKLCMIWFLVPAFPIYIWAYQNLSIASLTAIQIYLILGNAFQVAALSCVLPKLFPPSRRYSGVGFSYALGTALLGGTTPLIASWTVKVTSFLWAPAFFLFTLALLYGIAIKIIERPSQEINT
ncbi:MAG: MFS transporter [Alphaproteobacteria bacterium]|nr:MFS transporter [Alphaproteobacteria bacterium]